MAGGVLNGLRAQVVGALERMGCCNAKDFPVPGYRGSAPRPSSTGLRASELKAFDFTSEAFALEYTEQMTSSSVRRGAQEFLPGASSCQPPRTRRVPQDHKTIQEALDAAGDGDVVCVGPGCYREALVVRKRVLLYGLGEVRGIVLEGPDASIFFAASGLPTVVLEAAEARICNMTIVGGSGSAPVVENMCGDVTLEGCSIRGGSCCISVQQSAGALVRFCDVVGATGHGIQIAQQAWASVEKCLISDCPCGILVGHLGSQCSLRASDVLSCSQVGVMVHSAAAALLDGNNIRSNSVAGVCLAGNGRAVLANNVVVKNGKVGICVVEESAASINDNHVRENGIWSIYVAKCSARHVAARNNTVDTRHIPVVKVDAQGEAEVSMDAEADMTQEILFSTSPSSPQEHL